MLTSIKQEGRAIRHLRIRRAVRGTAERPRLAVFRSLNHVYAQLSDDSVGRTIVAPDSRSPEVRERPPKGGRVAAMNRVGKVVKGGRRFSFTALVVVGDGHGHVGVGLGKAREVPEAIRKSVEHGKKDLVLVPLKDTAIPCEITGHFGAARVFLRPASQGTGVIAGGAVRPLLEAAGVQDILTKTLGTNNPHNVLKATIDAFRRLKRLLDTHNARRRSVDGDAQEASGGKEA